MKTVKVIKKNWRGETISERRVELFDTDPDGNRRPAILCLSDETPRPRAGIAKKWQKFGEVCGPIFDIQQWWVGN